MNLKFRVNELVSIFAHTPAPSKYGWNVIKFKNDPDGRHHLIGAKKHIEGVVVGKWRFYHLWFQGYW